MMSMDEPLGGLELEIRRHLGTYIRGDGVANAEQMVDCMKAWTEAEGYYWVARRGKRYCLYADGTPLPLIFSGKQEAELVRRQLTLHMILAAATRNHPCPYMRGGDCSSR